jgi:hypothetical protein
MFSLVTRRKPKGKNAMDRQVLKLVARIAENLPEMSADVIQGWIENPKGLQKFLSGFSLATAIATVFHLIVDYNVSLSDMVKAGHYDRVADGIVESNFPRIKFEVEKIDVAFDHFDRSISSDSAVAEMDKVGYRPATIEGLLVFGAKNPEVQRQFPVVALGSSCVVGGCRYVAYLDGYGSGRGLYLRSWRHDWDGRSRFLAVGK